MLWPNRARTGELGLTRVVVPVQHDLPMWEGMSRE